jgi:hypothetical protein
MTKDPNVDRLALMQYWGTLFDYSVNYDRHAKYKTIALLR